MKRLVVIDIVGLNPSLLGEHTPHLNRLITDGFVANLEPVFPGVTCTAQASMLTGSLPREHGIVANGWYFRDLAEVWFWRQSNHLVHGEKVWDAAKMSIRDFSCAQLFWWYNMYADVEYSVTPRPIYPADGRKIPALYSNPADLHRRIEAELGPFPMFNFWGPAADLRSSSWIANAAKWTFDHHPCKLQLVYLPHLDYNLQRLGPADPRIWEDVRAIDAVAGDLIDHVRAQGADVMVVSEYGIEPATGCVHINKVLREQGYISVRETLGYELLDFGASRAFAVADHQIAHVYVRNASDSPAVERLLGTVPGIERVLAEQGKAEMGLDHPRSGELIAIAEPGHWFSYYYWQDDAKSPDFARTVDIHRKPGYDPVELFVDPDIRWPKLKIGFRLLQKQLGFRMLMDVIPLKPDLVKGTHGRCHQSADLNPVLISSRRDFAVDQLPITGIKQLILNNLN